MKTATGQILLTLTISEEEGGFSALCVETGTASCGDTLDEAVYNIKDAVRTELEAMQHLGELAQYLDEKGIEIDRPSARNPILLEPNLFVFQHFFDVIPAT